MSDAVGSEIISSVVGYKIDKGDFSTSSPNLPQCIAILGEANETHQSALVTARTQITSAKQAGELYGFGSPIYHAMRILRPLNGGGIGGIPTYVYAQAKASGATAKVIEINVSGVATGNGTHTFVIAGREGVDGERYDINIEVGDTVAEITQKIQDAVNNVLGSPVLANGNTYSVIFTAKWKGLTSNEITVTVDDNDDALGLSYTTETIASGAGTPSIAAALTSFGNDWNTVVVNTYGTVDAVLDSLEATNGRPSPTTPTGKYTGTIMKPFIALTGSVADDPSSITDERLLDVTIAICPAPASPGLSMEAAANVALLFARIAQDSPHKDIQDAYYPDMPVPSNGDIGSMASHTNRDVIVKKGCSTVELVAGQYRMKDFVSTYHPVGELPPQFRYCRNIMLDLNIFYGYYLLQQTHLVGATIADDNEIIDVTGVMKPKDWKQIILNYFVDLAARALITETTFSDESLTVEISDTNPDRLDTSFSYKRTGTVRIASTNAKAGFKFGA